MRETNDGGERKGREGKGREREHERKWRMKLFASELRRTPELIQGGVLNSTNVLYMQ